MLFISIMKPSEIISFWKKSAWLDKKTANALFNSKSYVGCLFFTHLYLEKVLKGLVQKATGKTPPFTHDLLVLAKIANMALTEEQQNHLAVINIFNIRARYADYKFSLYKKATRNFTAKFCKIAEELYKWFLKQY